ncbi:MAG: hypothetical protein Q7J28_02785 [Caulobacter sp.]|nr:hypothetical protein [Caulobacter sp.]
MDFFKDRRIVLAVGGGVALLLGILIAVTIMRGSKAPAEPPPASQGGLVVETGRDDDTRLDPARPIRCFVAGQFAGEITLTECAQRNGVATGALDVGVDETGALAAADAAGTILAPLPPKPIAPAPVQTAPTASSEPAQPAPSGSMCWRYSGGGWSQAGSMDLNSCVQTLFAGQCEKRGGATYGRWGEQTLRLVRDKVEISQDNRRFRTLVEQGANCSIPPVG